MITSPDSMETNHLRVADSFTDAYALFNADNKLLDWSKTLSDFFPVTAQKLNAGMHFDSFLRLPGECGDLDPSINADAFDGDSTDAYCKLADGRTINLKVIPLSDAGRVFVCSDVTHTRRQQLALAASDLKFRQFATLASNWFWELDENLCYLYHSDHCTPLAGSDPASLVGQPRILKLRGKVVDDDQLDEHNRCLLQHQDIDVVLTWIKEDGRKIYSRILAKPQYDQGRFTGFIGCGRDVSASYELRELLKYKADHDDLTGLLNRRAFTERLDQALADKQPNELPHALVKFNLDRFKLVNDNAGHLAGDALLKDVTSIIRHNTHERAFVARLGGDEFGVYLQADPVQAQIYSDNIIRSIDSHRFEWQNQIFSIGASAGIALFDENTTQGSVVLKKADAACYSAKRLGRNRALIFSPENYIQLQENEERKKVHLLQSAMDNDRLKIYLQPIVPAGQPENTMKYEVLLRVIDEHDQIISPGELIPVAEKFDLMQLIDMQVVEKSIEHLQTFLQQDLDVAFSVNLSGNTLSNASCLQRISSMVRSSRLPPQALGFEITETSAIESIDLVVKFIDQMRGMGCQFSIDDFGCGLSSYNYMSALQVDYLKIDGSFVSNILDDHTSLAIVKSINTLSHEMGMKTVAEFVETEAVARALRNISIDYLQGYLYGKPAKAEDVLAQYQQIILKTGA